MFGDTPLVMVEDDQTLAEVVEALRKAAVIGIDTESDSSYAYQEKVCLIQLSDLERDYIVDPLLVDDISSLGPLLADPSIPKVLHGADYDIVCLKRDHGFQIRGLFDTLIAAQLLGLERIGLADLIERFFGVPIDKQYQRHNWALRPLRPEHLEYARGDTHFLHALREILIRRLERVDRMEHLKEECEILEEREWAGKEFDPDGYVDLKGARSLDTESKRVLRRLYMYRDRQGKRMNRPVYKVIPNDVMIKIAYEQPTSQDDLDRLFSSKNAMKRRHGSAMVTAVLQGLEDEVDVPDSRRRPKSKGQPRPKGPKARLRGRQAERAMFDLKDWRNKKLKSNRALTPFTVASNTTLKAIASRRPYTIEELHEIPDVRRWQVRDFGEELLRVLEHIDPSDED